MYFIFIGDFPAIAMLVFPGVMRTRSVSLLKVSEGTILLGGKVKTKQNTFTKIHLFSGGPKV